MVLTSKTIYFPLPSILLSGNPLPYNYSFKFLGLIIDFKLSWTNHLNRIRSKLASVCGILFNIRRKISRAVAKIIYLSIGLPYIQYCNIIWASCAISKMQSIFICQKRIIRLILKKNRYQTTSPLFKKLKLLQLHDINNLNAAQFVFKSINGLIPSPITFIHNAPGPYNLRRTDALIIPFTRSQQSKRFISIKGAELWNAIPLIIRSSLTIHNFKKKLKEHYLHQYE